MITTAECVSHLLSCPAIQVEAITLCGSHRQGTADEYSDRDLWVFCSNRQPISDHLATTVFLPVGAAREILFEGRDDTLTDHTVVNVLTEEVLNLKFLHTQVLTTFCRTTPHLEAQYMEDLENYLTMRPLHDPLQTVSDHQKWLTLNARDTMPQWLTPQILARYGSTYWRSAYQGVLRGDEHPWRHLVTHLVELLAWAHFVNHAQVPPPRKWLFSARLLGQLPHGELIRDVLTRLSAASVSSSDGHAQVIGVYNALAHAEDAILPAAGERDMWWRSVFTQRIPHLALHLGRTELGALAAAAPVPREHS